MKKIFGFIKKLFRVSFFIGIMTALYSIIYLPRTLKVESIDYTFESDTKLTIVQISDIHISIFYPERRLKKIVKTVNKQNADIIVFTGDFYDRDRFFGSKDNASHYLKNLKSKYGNYAIYGNHDYAGKGSKIFEKTMKDGGLTLLKNNGVNVTLDNDETIFIGGSDDFLLGVPSIKATMSNQNLDSTFNLLLIHEPDVADYFIKEKVDLILAGHSHNGQINLPFYRFYNRLARKYLYGYYQLQNKTNLFVSSGIGCSWLPIRFGVSPEIVVHNINVN